MNLIFQRRRNIYAPAERVFRDRHSCDAGSVYERWGHLWPRRDYYHRHHLHLLRSRPRKSWLVLVYIVTFSDIKVKMLNWTNQVVICF